MNRERYDEINKDLDAELTEDEMAEGWFFCCEFDGLLINKESLEATVCTCHKDDRDEKV